MKINSKNNCKILTIIVKWTIRKILVSKYILKDKHKNMTFN